MAFTAFLSAVKTTFKASLSALIKPKLYQPASQRNLRFFPPFLIFSLPLFYQLFFSLMHLHWLY
jgi:hypothetical protein